MCKISPVSRQFISVVCCNLLTLAYGLSDGCAQINFVELQNENSTYPTGPLDSEELALTVSIANIGGLVGNFAVIPISRLIGVKLAIHLCGVPLILSSVLLVYAQDANYLHVSRILGGIAGGASAVAIPTLINDISFDNVRGALNAIYDPSYNVGIILSYLIANFMDCLNQAKAQMILPGIFLVVMFFLPESPEFWIKKNVQKVQNFSDFKSHVNKINLIRGAIAEAEKAEFLPDSTNGQQNREKLDLVNVDNNVNQSLSERMSGFCTPAARKAFLISFTGIVLSFFSGIWILLTYITDVFDKTGSALSEKNSSLLVSIAPLITNLLFVNVVERFNRKTLYMFSSIMCAMFFFLFAVYCQLWLKQPSYEWLPPFCFTFIILFNIREMAIAFGISMVWMIFFLIGYIFPFLLNTIGIAACMALFGFICLLNTIFCIVFVPETRGKSYEEIMEIMTK